MAAREGLCGLRLALFYYFILISALNFYITPSNHKLSYFITSNTRPRGLCTPNYIVKYERINIYICKNLIQDSLREVTNSVGSFFLLNDEAITKEVHDSSKEIEASRILIKCSKFKQSSNWQLKSSEHLKNTFLQFLDFS